MTATQRILRGTAANHDIVLYSAGTATDADGTVTVSAVNAAGSEAVASTSATNPATGTYRHTVSQQTNLNKWITSS